MPFVDQIAHEFGINVNSVLFKYLKRKTRASDRGSKARRSLGNLYALYVLAEDYINENTRGSRFTDLMTRMKSKPFGSKLQNHPLDNRLNDEVQRQYGVGENMLPVQAADLGDGGKARKISTDLLSEACQNPSMAARFIVDTIDRYISIIGDNQTAYLDEIENSTTDEEIYPLISKAFIYESDAREFEIVSHALLFMKYKDEEITYIFNGEEQTEPLILYKTGRTNANDGGIDFVLKPLGRFFQVTETLDFKKYFLDLDKTNRFPITFVIKTELSPNQVMDAITRDASAVYNDEEIRLYTSLFEEIITNNQLREILRSITESPDKIRELKQTVIDSFKLEFGILE